MTFFNSENITYFTGLKKDEILLRLQNVTKDPKSFFKPKKNKKRYEGKIYDCGFVVNRVIGFKHSYPLLVGSIIEEDNKTRINIELKYYPLIKNMFCIWVCFLILMFLIMLFSLLLKGFYMMSILSLAPLLMIALGYFLTNTCFKWECATEKQYLKKLFEAEQDTV
jgi:hypothetical protein